MALKIGGKQMQRRQLLKSMVSLGAGSLLLNTPFNALAKVNSPQQAVNFKLLFNQALVSNPELIGFANVEDNFQPQVLSIEGVLPKDLVGTFYRNGPAKHERGEARYQHLFEGDGMLQRFTFSDGKIRHQGKFIATPKFQKEQQAQRFLYSGPETIIKQLLPVSNADMINTANTNIIAVGNDLWALWEAGSPTKVDEQTLEYKGQINLGAGGKYQNSLQGLPFSAHPKIEANGDIWNFGLNATGHVVLYHLAANGQVKNVGLINAEYHGGMLHDFLITDKHLLVILPSLNVGHSSDKNRQGLFSRIEFDQNQPMRVLVVSKSDLSIKKQYELPAGFAFHYGNAWEEKDGTIRFDASLYANVDVLQNLSNIMQGNMDNANTDAKTVLFTLNPDGTAMRNVMDLNSEFPRICNHLTGLRNQYLYQLSSSHNSLWSDTVCSLNLETGKQDSFDFGKDYLVEEHIIVCPKKVEGTGYLIGTALHVPSKRTCLNVFKADDLASGPMARAWLSHHLPLGFHGNFKHA
jgi:all-trans-8'-apo-beta-carotenal 15,15'-oxygenase